MHSCTCQLLAAAARQVRAGTQWVRMHMSCMVSIHLSIYLWTMMDVAAMQAAFVFCMKKSEYKRSRFTCMHSSPRRIARTVRSLVGACSTTAAVTPARAYIGPLIGRSQLDSRLPESLCLPRQIGTYDDDDDDDVDTLQVMSYQCKAGPIYTTPSMAPPCSISHPSQLASVPNHRRIISSSPH